jgi:predicted patatin/cPLA2 family phospholipase
MEKYGLVLEGGGMRGAYTAGALAWLNDNHITFDYGVGVSSGAVYMACYWEGDKHTPYNMSVHYAADPNNVGIKAFFHCGYYVDYQQIFDKDILGREHMTVQPLIDMQAPIEFGCYDMAYGDTVFFNWRDLDDNLTVLRASSALPVASAMVQYKGKDYMDGGICRLIPIERSIEQGVTKHLVITTKPADYHRKPANKIVIQLMKKCYPQYPTLVDNYKIRHLNYYKQVDIIKDLSAQGKALKILPSKSIKMGRFKGSAENCDLLYKLGYQDMEDRRQEICRFLDLETKA